jgi:hypothetical protein
LSEVYSVQKLSGPFTIFCNFEEIQIYASFIAKQMPLFQNRKRKGVFTKNKEKAGGADSAQNE